MIFHLMAILFPQHHIADTVQINPDDVLIYEGDTVVVETDWYGRQTGIVQCIDTSPYYFEEKQGIERAYITSLPGQPAWSTWALAYELEKVVQ